MQKLEAEAAERQADLALVVRNTAAMTDKQALRRQFRTLREERDDQAIRNAVAALLKHAAIAHSMRQAALRSSSEPADGLNTGMPQPGLRWRPASESSCIRLQSGVSLSSGRRSLAMVAGVRALATNRRVANASVSWDATGGDFAVHPRKGNDGRGAEIERLLDWPGGWLHCGCHSMANTYSCGEV